MPFPTMKHTAQTASKTTEDDNMSLYFNSDEAQNTHTNIRKQNTTYVWYLTETK